MFDTEEIENPESWKKPFFRYSLRAFLLVTAVLAIWFGYRSNIARREQPAISLIRENGGSVRYSHDISKNRPTFAPRFLRESLGDEYFGRVVRVNFQPGKPESDAALSLLYRLSAVTVVNTDETGSGITNDGLEQVARLSRLTTLRIPNASIDDDGLIHLTGLRSLTLLDLSGNKISGSGLYSLAGLRNLELLTLSKTKVTDEAILSIGELPRLRYLNVSDTPVTESGALKMKTLIPWCQINYGNGKTLSPGAN